MTEIMARIAANGHVELIDERGIRIDKIPPLTPNDAAYLARGILACAIATFHPNPPKVGEIGADIHMPIANWTVAASAINGDVLLLLTVPSAIALTFAMSKEGAIEIGRALVARGQGIEPLGDRSGMVH